MTTPAADDHLVVRLHERPVGRLTRPGSGRLRFAYDETTDARDRLSVSLPVRTERFRNRETRPFFEGLLPEGALRERIARERGVSPDNAFGLLAEIGADCAGAVAISPAGVPPARIEAPLAVEWLSDDALARLLADLPAHPLGHGPDVRLSLGGVQDKLVLVRRPDGRFGRPLHGTPSTVIVKPTTDEWHDIAANEWFCLRLARSCGLVTAEAALERIGGVRCLVVERFDRSVTGETVRRIHQEDFCQALGLLPTAKYEAEGGPSVAVAVELLRAESAAPAADINRFVRALAFNVLVGNSDAHGKNFALLYGGTRPRLAPLYDIVSTAVYPVTTRLAMFVGGVDEPERVDAAAWRRLAGEAGLNGPLLVRAVRTLAEQVAFGASTLVQSARSEGWHTPIVDEIHAIIVRRADRLVGR